MILITGTGRCGTGYIAQVLTSAGVPCTHEGIFTADTWKVVKGKLELRLANPSWNWKADSSWLAASLLPKLTPYNLTTVHLTRHPKQVMDSHLRLMLYTHPTYGPYYHWMEKRLPELSTYTDPVAKTALWYIRLNEMIEPYTDIRHKVEDDPHDLLDSLNIFANGKQLFSDTTYNSRFGFGPSNVNIIDIPKPLQSDLLAMSDRYGYQWTVYKPDTIMAGWFDDRWIPIDHISAHVGGSWQLRDDAGNPLCYDSQLVKFFYDKIRQVDNPTIIDVGASTGNFTLLPIVHSGATVHAFEPNPVAFRSLKSNVAINGISNQVHLYQIALSDTTTAGTLKTPIPALHAAVACLGDGQPRPRGFEWNEVPVDIKRLDDYNFAPDFIKIDVEGAELLVLRGAESTIKQYHPGILVEYTSLNTNQFGYDRESIIDQLKVYGYNHFKQVGLEDLWAEVLPQ